MNVDTNSKEHLNLAHMKSNVQTVVDMIRRFTKMAIIFTTEEIVNTYKTLLKDRNIVSYKDFAKRKWIQVEDD